MGDQTKTFGGTSAFDDALAFVHAKGASLIDTRRQGSISRVQRAIDEAKATEAVKQQASRDLRVTITLYLGDFENLQVRSIGGTDMLFDFKG